MISYLRYWWFESLQLWGYLCVYEISFRKEHRLMPVKPMWRNVPEAGDLVLWLWKLCRKKLSNGRACEINIYKG